MLLFFVGVFVIVFDGVGFGVIEEEEEEEEDSRRTAERLFWGFGKVSGSLKKSDEKRAPINNKENKTQFEQ